MVLRSGSSAARTMRGAMAKKMQGYGARGVATPQSISANAAAGTATVSSTFMREYNLPDPRSNTTKLREMFQSNELEFLMEAHNGLSAKIVEEAGFKGIWASGLSISAALGVRDSNEASWTQIIEAVEYMQDAVDIPILLDGDTGFGNYNHARHLITKLESRGIAGVCLEDKLFPKQPSFIDGETQPLADIHEFCGKIMACKDTQKDGDFNVVARLEAFTTGHGIDEAVKRAEAYHKAGADAILCHSKLNDDTEIRQFMDAWDNRCPVIIVPTKYFEVPTSTFEEYGVSTVIWANHNMRASISVMQETTKSIFESKSLNPVEKAGKVVPVSEVLRLQNTKEVQEAEAKEHVLRAMDETHETKCEPQAVVETMRANGTTFFCGVPDSLLKNFCDYVTSNTTKDEHVIAANEGTACAMAAGHHLATGQIPVVYLQNSGLGNIVNPILSLADTKVYSVPMILMIGWRGEPGKKDEPQHGVQGKCTPSLLKEMGIPYEVMPDYNEGMQEAMGRAYSYVHNRSAPFAFLIKKNTFEKYKMEPQVQTDYPMNREFALNMILDAFPDTPLVTTTGFTSREVFELREARGEGHGDDFLTVGSMGHCSSIALGIANARPEKNVVAVDGDGAALMHLGGMASVGLSGRTNFKHILINNGMHDSVGGQPTGGLGIDFTAMAKACGYAEALTVETEAETKAALEYLSTATVEGPVMIEIKVKGGSRSDLGRPTTTPIENKVAFMKKLGALP